MARNLIDDYKAAYAISTEVAVQKLGDPVDLRSWCDTVADFETAFQDGGIELRYDGLVTYEREGQRWVGCRKLKNGTWEWSYIMGAPIAPVVPNAIKICHPVHTLAPSRTDKKSEVQITVTYDPINSTVKDYSVEFEPTNVSASFDKLTGLLTAGDVEETFKMKLKLVENPAVVCETQVVVTNRAIGIYTPVTTVDIVQHLNNNIEATDTGDINVKTGNIECKSFKLDATIKALEFKMTKRPVLTFASNDSGDEFIGCCLNNAVATPGSVTHVVPKADGGVTLSNLIHVADAEVYPVDSDITVVMDEEHNNKFVVYVKRPADQAYQKGFEINLNDSALMAHAGAKNLIDNKLGLGIASIGSDSDGIVAKAMHKITRNPDSTELITDVNAGEARVEINQGESHQLTPSYKPENTTHRRLAWQSSREEIATVSQGLITAIKEGACSVGVSPHTNPSLINWCAVTVLPPRVQSISFVNTPSSVLHNNTHQLEVNILPANAADKSVTWATSNPAIAIVDNTGLVTGVGVGTCDIVVTSVGNSNVSARFRITIGTNYVRDVVVPSEYGIHVGEEAYLYGEVVPTEATDHDLRWTIDNESLATITEQGKVRGVRAGIANVTVNALGVWSSNPVRKTVRLRVTNDPEAKVKGVHLNPIGSVRVGFNAQATWLVTPTYAKDKSVRFISSDTNVGTITDSGLFTAKALGKTTITVSTVDGGFIASQTVDVISNMHTYFRLNPATATIQNGLYMNINLETDESKAKPAWYVHPVDAVVKLGLEDQHLRIQAKKRGVVTISAQSAVTGAVATSTITII